MEVESLIVSLYELEAVKFGDFTLKSGISSPVYFDLRVLVAAPKLLDAVAESLHRLASESGVSFGVYDANSASVSQICGVPYTALPIATCISARHDVPMIIRRKEAKDYGTKKLLEGKWVTGESCLVVEDVVTSGSSVLDTTRVLRQAGLVVDRAVVILDREQGGLEALQAEGVSLKSLFTTSKVLEVLSKKNLIDAATSDRVREFVAAHRFDAGAKLASTPSSIDVPSLTYESRSARCQPGTVSAKLLSIMSRKRTNLCVAVDEVSVERFLAVAAAVGPHVCLLKTHVDILEDFDATVPVKLRALAEAHDFLLFEDRKFADIGNTVQAQYGKGIYKIAEWADVVNAHPLPGPGVVNGLNVVAESIGEPRGCLLVAEMSSGGNLATKDYYKSAIKMAQDHPGHFVFGFIAQSRPDASVDQPDWIVMTPGVNSGAAGDALGQNYRTPDAVVGQNGADVVIVGRGVTKAENIGAAAAEYRRLSWEAYQKRVKN